MSNKLKVGIYYVNSKDITINKLDYSEVVKITSETIKTSIDILTGNNYIVSKRKITNDVSTLNYIISASGMYGEYCGTNDNNNFIFKVLQNTTIIDDKNNIAIIVPVNTKITLSKISSNGYQFVKQDKLININNNNSELQKTVNKVINNTYSSIRNIGNTENVMKLPNNGGEKKKYRKPRKYMASKKHNPNKIRKTRKNR